MNSDDFEKRLQAQRLRKVPEDWRAMILQTARSEASPAVQEKAVALRVWLTVWRELLQPCRYAWLSMAALWLVFWMVNTQTRLSDSPRHMAMSTPRSTQPIWLFEEQRQALAELTGPSGLSPAEPARPAHPKPRSEGMYQTRSG